MDIMSILNVHRIINGQLMDAAHVNFLVQSLADLLEFQRLIQESQERQPKNPGQPADTDLDIDLTWM